MNGVRRGGQRLAWIEGDEGAAAIGPHVDLQPARRASEHADAEVHHDGEQAVSDGHHAGVIVRTAYAGEVQRLLKANPVVAILGPRQVGETMLARAVAQGQPHHLFDLEDPVAAARLAHPQTTLEPNSICW
jgi:hypothetical protein